MPKRASHILRRALYILKRSLYKMKTPLFTPPIPVIVGGPCDEFVGKKGLYLYSKYIFSTHPYILPLPHIHTPVIVGGLFDEFVEGRAERACVTQHACVWVVSCVMPL